MHPMNMQRKILRIPEFSRLPQQVRGNLDRIDDLIDHIIDELPQISDFGLGIKFHEVPEKAIGLIHNLSEFYTDPPVVPMDLKWSRNEARVLKAEHKYLRSECAKGEICSLEQKLCSLMRYFTNQVELRREPVYTKPDSAGRYVVYPSYELVEGQLKRISEFIDNEISRRRAFTFMVFVVSILNCHPFVDGNGRISRIFGNYIINHRLDSPLMYFPLKEINYLAQGGYFLRIRCAEMHDEWGPLAEFLYKSLSYWMKNLKGSEICFKEKFQSER